MRRKPKLISPVHIVDLAHKGKGIGKDNEGNVYLVDDVVPGDIVEFLFFKKKKGLRAGQVQKIIEYSPARVEATCEHFGVCGGCKWQNFEYKEQLRFKEKLVRDSIQRLAKDSPEKVKPIVGCDEQLYYRNKLEYSFSTHRWLTKDEIESDIKFDDMNALGFHRPGSFNKIVDVQTCHLQEGLTNDIRNFIRSLAKENELSFFNIKEHKGLLRNLILRNNRKGEWMLILSMYYDDKEARETLLEAIKNEFPQIISLQYVINGKKNDTLYDQEIVVYSGDANLTEELGDVKFNIGPKSFFQTNTRQAEVLYSLVGDYANLGPNDILYDLYTGIGSIALSMAKNCSEVIGVEEVPAAIEDAKKNAIANDISNCHFYAGDVKEVMNDALIQKHGAPSILITDPPRAGMHKDVVAHLNTLRIPKIVYVSCNPATQARDIEILKDVYELVELTPVDMFPQTHHVESVALLRVKT